MSALGKRRADAEFLQGPAAGTVDGEVGVVRAVAERALPAILRELREDVPLADVAAQASRGSKVGHVCGGERHEFGLESHGPCLGDGFGRLGGRHVRPVTCRSLTRKPASFAKNARKRLSSPPE